MKKVLLVFFLLLIGCNKNSKNIMIDFTNLTVDEIVEYCDKYNLNLQLEEEYSDLKKGSILSQSIEVNSEFNFNDNIKVIISKGIDYETLKVNELGNVPIMMYHGIHNITDNKYIGGNVDIDGYQRTKEAFEQDLEFYYQNGYRMIRLVDYVNGIIDVQAGFSPIVLTFDDGFANNIKVLGLNDNGEIIIDPNSAVGVLENFKSKYPDFNVTATFFINGELFNQSKYNEKILNWLIDHGYDIGNHSYSHPDFTKIDALKSVQEIGSMYNILDKYIPNKYVNIVALPYGSPYSEKHENFKYIINGEYNDRTYSTIATLAVGWMYDYSPFDKNFNSKIIKRIRAWDANGKDWDIEKNFNSLNKVRYISDGDKDTIAFPNSKASNLGNDYNLKVFVY